MLKKILISIIIVFIVLVPSLVSADNDAQENATYNNNAESVDSQDASTFATDKITSPNFEISTGGWGLGLGASKQGSTSGKVNFALGTLIQKMMIAMTSLAFLIMVIGGIYMVAHHGEDEFLNKGKLIFMAGVYSLVIALSSYFIVGFIRFILYV